MKNVSYGDDLGTIELNSGYILDFDDNRIIYAVNIDARNLSYCRYLNLAFSSICYIDTEYLANLLVLVVSNSDIYILNTFPLKNLQYLSAKNTNI